MGRRTFIGCLDDHPNAAEIVGVIARVPHIADAELPTLAAHWRNTMAVAEARSRALEPDSPLIFDALAAFDAVQALWEDDLSGQTELEPDVVSNALKAVRDAIAAAYARPILGRSAYSLLMRPWRAVYPVDDRREPDLGRRGAEVRGLLASLRWLSTRCHDAAAATRYDGLATLAWLNNDADLRTQARDEAWAAATLTGRKRTWGLIRRNATMGLAEPCARCGRRPIDADLAGVTGLCLDAACGLLVADAIADNLLTVLTEPVRPLIPEPRPATY